MNQREIKFRFYNKDSGKIFNPYRTGNLYNYIRPVDGMVIEVQEGQKRGELIEREQTHLIPLQFTGLLDKFGKEIYQSDLIQHIADGTAPHPILEVVWWDEKYAWAVKDQFGGYAMLWPERDIKVIGNIYETPDLLPKGE